MGYSEDGNALLFNGKQIFRQYEFTDEEIYFPNPTWTFGLVKDGYQFKNWLMIYIDNGIPSNKGEYFDPHESYSGSMLKDYDTEEDAKDTDITCYLAAQWEPMTTTVQLLSNGMQPSVQYVYAKYETGWFSDYDTTNMITQLTTLPQPLDGKAFVGYYTEPGGQGDLIIGQSGYMRQLKPDFINDNVTLYAHSQEIPERTDFGIIYEKNFGRGALEKGAQSTIQLYYDWYYTYDVGYYTSFTYGVDEEVTLAPITSEERLKRNDGGGFKYYTFVGWARDPNKRGIDYENGATIPCEPNDIFIYAIYKRTVTLTCYINDDGNKIEVKQDIYANDVDPVRASFSLKGLSPIRKGYNFLGWSTSSKGSSVNYTSDQTLSLIVDTSLYPVWEKQKVNIVYNYDTNKSKSLTQSFEYNDTSENSQWFGRAADGSLLWIPEEGVDIYTSKYGFGPWSWIGKKITGWIDKNNIEYKNSLTNPNSEYEDKYVTVTNTWIIAHDNETINLYPILDPNGAANIYTDSQWKVGLPYIFIGGEWKQALPYIYNGSEWKIGV